MPPVNYKCLKRFCPYMRTSSLPAMDQSEKSGGNTVDRGKIVKRNSLQWFLDRFIIYPL